MRSALALILVFVFAAPALAQSTTPLSGPNNSTPSPVCDIINFGFCPQPAPPPPVLPDPDAEAAAAAKHPPLPAPPHRHGVHRYHRPAAG